MSYYSPASPRAPGFVHLPIEGYAKLQDYKSPTSHTLNPCHNKASWKAGGSAMPEYEGTPFFEEVEPDELDRWALAEHENDVPSDFITFDECLEHLGLTRDDLHN